MDNTNDSNSSNNLNPGLPQQQFNAPLPDFPSAITPSNPSAPALPDLSSVWTPPTPIESGPTASNPLPENVQQAGSVATPAAQSPSIPDLASTWSPSPVNPMPQAPQSLAEPPPPQLTPTSTLSVNNPVSDQASQPVNSPVWPNFPVQQDQPQTSAQPTWMPANPTAIQPEIPAANLNPDSTTSPLNNPWTTPIPNYPQNQSQASAQPTWMPNHTTAQPDPISAISNNAQDLAGGTLPAAVYPEQPAVQSDPAPTDLSHLISNNPSVTPTAPETLIVPSQTNNPVLNLPASPQENHKGIPMWLIGIGIGLLLIVAGASAYFILGVGQRQQTAVSIPAEVAKTTVKTPPPIPAPTPIPAATQSASESANFGQFQASPPPKASSAADLLRQRQQQGR